MTALEWDRVTKDYGDLKAIDRVSLRVDRGEQVMLVGPNGSGKTTMLRVAAGLLDASAGEVTVDGHRAGSVEARAALSFVGDTPVLYDDLSVWEHLEYVGRMHGVVDWPRPAGVLLDRLGLSDRRHDLPVRFSRGLRQKTAVAIAFIRPFAVLLVDEPFVGLDRPGRTALLELLGEAAAGGAAVVVATHQAAYAHQASRLVGMRDGRVVTDGRPSPDVVAEFVGDPLAGEAPDEGGRSRRRD